jgi:hypothetical protein
MNCYAKPFIEGQTVAELIHDLFQLSGVEQALAVEPAAGTDR